MEIQLLGSAQGGFFFEPATKTVLFVTPITAD